MRPGLRTEARALRSLLVDWLLAGLLFYGCVVLLLLLLVSVGTL